MFRIKLALAALLAGGSAMVTAPEPANADQHFGQARNWMTQRFQAGSPPVRRQVLLDRPSSQRTPSVRKVAVDRSPPVASRRQFAGRVAQRQPGNKGRRAVQRLAYSPYQGIYYRRPVVQRVYVVHWPLFLQ